jgi:hypothetical protein
LKCYLTVSAALFVVACASPEERRRAEIMNAIEKEIQLPQGAGEMTRYARTYKFASPDRVIGFYFVPDKDYDDWFCQGAKKGGATNGQIALACPPPDGIAAGERRWFDADVHMPAVSDGGCNYVDVEYDMKTNRVTSARCHGTA